MDRAKALGMLLLTVAVILFAGQNLESVEVVFLSWHFYVPLSLIALVPLLIGLVIGTAGTAVVIRRRDHKAGPAAEPGPLTPGTDDARLSEPAAQVPVAEIKDEEEIPR